MKRYLPFLVVLFSIILGSCVSNSKYRATLLEKGRLQQENERLRGTYASNEIQKSDLLSVQDQLKDAQVNYKDLFERYQSLSNTHGILEKRFEEEVLLNQKLLDNASKANLDLSESTTKSASQLNKSNQQLTQTKAELDRKELQLKNLEQRLVSREAKVKELENLISGKDEALQELKRSINNALLGFSDADLSVYQKNGKIYVSLSQKLLFKTGSDKLDKNGTTVIKKLANVLREKPDLDIFVEGHTDSEGTARYNWDLSTKRATRVVKLLVDTNVQPGKIVAAGRGEHVPIADNKTEEGRAKNRRTEIILSPNIDKIYQIINQ